MEEIMRFFENTKLSYEKLSNISWVIFNAASKYRSVSVNRSDVGNNIYTIPDVRLIGRDMSIYTAKSGDVVLFFDQELDMYQRRQGKYRNKPEVGILKAFKYGPKIANETHGRLGNGSKRPRKGCTLTHLLLILMLSVGRADSVFSPIFTPPNKQSVFNHIGSASASVGMVCGGLAVMTGALATAATASGAGLPGLVLLGPAYVGSVICAQTAAVVSASCTVADTTTRFVGHVAGEQPLTPAQIAGLGVDSAVSLGKMVVIPMVSNMLGDQISNAAKYGVIPMAGETSAEALGFLRNGINRALTPAIGTAMTHVTTATVISAASTLALLGGDIAPIRENLGARVGAAQQSADNVVAILEQVIAPGNYTVEPNMNLPREVAKIPGAVTNRVVAAIRGIGENESTRYGVLSYGPAGAERANNRFEAQVSFDRSVGIPVALIRGAVVQSIAGTVSTIRGYLPSLPPANVPNP